MKQEVFEARYASAWDAFEQAIGTLSGDAREKAPDSSKEFSIGREFPAMYRQICHHLSLARARRYSYTLQQRLNQLALDGHQHLYRSRTPFLHAIGRFFAYDFPVALRTHWKFMLASAALFYLPLLLMMLAIQVKPELIFSLIDPGQVAGMEEMYDPENVVLGRERESDTDVQMFGFYIYNNISIGFRTFAGGLLFGLGSIFFLVFNGLFIGAIASHLTTAGASSTFWPFVVGHSSFELNAIVIFGGVGMMLGYRAIAPGRKRRWHAIRDAAMAGMPLIYGGTVMLVAAAFVEAFWSSTTWPPSAVKYTVGGILWLLLGLYFTFLGRNES